MQVKPWHSQTVQIVCAALNSMLHRKSSTQALDCVSPRGCVAHDGHASKQLNAPAAACLSATACTPLQAGSMHYLAVCPFALCVPAALLQLVQQLEPGLWERPFGTLHQAVLAAGRQPAWRAPGAGGECGGLSGSRCTSGGRRDARPRCLLTCTGPAGLCCATLCRVTAPELWSGTSMRLDLAVSTAALCAACDLGCAAQMSCTVVSGCSPAIIAGSKCRRQQLLRLPALLLCAMHMRLPWTAWG